MKTEEVKIGERVVRARGNNVGLVGKSLTLKNQESKLNGKILQELG